MKGYNHPDEISYKLIIWNLKKSSHTACFKSLCIEGYSYSWGKAIVN